MTWHLVKSVDVKGDQNTLGTIHKCHFGGRVHSGFKAKHYVSISDAGQIANNAIDQKGVFLYHKYTLNIPFDTMDLYQSYNLKTTKNGHFTPNCFFSNRFPSNQIDF